MVDILVLGATGYTGELVTEYLQAHPDRSRFTFAIAGRSQSKLEAIKKKYNIGEDVPVIIADVTKPDEVEQAVLQARVVISCVGPYFRWGAPVVRACAKHGKHYVDINGEQYWVLDMIYEYHFLATKTHSTIVPSCGFDSIPSDIIVYLANKTLKGFVGPDAGIDSSISSWDLSSGVSGGTLNTLFSTFEEVPKHKLIHAAKDHALSTAIRGEPSPAPRLLYHLPFSTVYGALWPMKFANRAIVQRTWGLHQFAVSTSDPTSPESKTLSYGPKFKYDEFWARPGKVSAVLMTVGFSLFMLALSIPPIRWLVKRLLPQPGDGPTEKGGYLAVTNVTSSAPTPSKPPTHIRTILRGKGNGYELTGVMAAESALSLALQYDELPAMGRKGGVLTPASALGDVLVKRLEKSGRMAFESEVILDGEDHKTR